MSFKPFAFYDKVNDILHIQWENKSTVIIAPEGGKMGDIELAVDSEDYTKVIGVTIWKFKDRIS